MVTASTALTAGDIVVVNTTATPTDVRYNWHIVTTGAAVNHTDLKLDGAASAPAYVSGSRFSKITPTATGAVNGSNQLTLNLSVGDLVFGKVTANADNPNTFAWHVVTTAENISGAIPNTLRLDGATGELTFAASTQVSKITPGAQDLRTTPTLLSWHR